MGDKFHKKAGHFAGAFGLSVNQNSHSASQVKSSEDDQAKRDREAAERAAKEKAAKEAAEAERLKKLEEERKRKAEADRATGDLQLSAGRAAREAQDQDVSLSVV